MPKKPPCFDSQKQFNAWQNAAWETGLNAKFGFCVDCSPWFKAHNYLHGNCIRPDVTFEKGEDGLVDGRVPLQPSEMAQQLMEKHGWC